MDIKLYGNNVKIGIGKFFKPLEEKWFALPSPLRLAMLNFMSYFIITINFRAVAEANYLWTFITDIILACLGFTVLKHIQEANSKFEMICYAIGGAIGAQIAIFTTLHALLKH